MIHFESYIPIHQHGSHIKYYVSLIRYYNIVLDIIYSQTFIIRGTWAY